MFTVTKHGSDELFVLKKIPAHDLNDASDAQAEAKDLLSLRHQNIVRYEDDFLHYAVPTTSRDIRIFVCIVMEHCPTDLRKEIEDRRDSQAPFANHEIARITSQVTAALRYCHSRGIVHRGTAEHNTVWVLHGRTQKYFTPFNLYHCRSIRLTVAILITSLLRRTVRLIHSFSQHVRTGCVRSDIKPQNVFVAMNGDVRIGDFGLSRQVNKAFVTSYSSAGTDSCTLALADISEPPRRSYISETSHHLCTGKTPTSPKQPPHLIHS